MGNSASGLPFDVGASIPYPGCCTHWQLFEGSKKDNAEESVTIFKFLKTQKDKQTLAVRAQQKLRTLKHPYVLSFLEGAEMEESIFLVTESCIPLDTWLERIAESGLSEEEQQSLIAEMAWGFRCIVNALQFLHSTCSLVHGYLGMHAIFVVKNGDWKLGSLDLASNLSIEDDASFFSTHNHLLLRPYIAPERQQMTRAETLQSAFGAMDVFSLAHCIQQSFSRAKMDVPANFEKYLQRMLTVDVRKRPTASQLATCPIFNTEHTQLMSSLGDLSIKPPSESLEILGQITSRVPEIPRTVCIHKILPSVARALQMACNDFPARNTRESSRQSVQLSLTLLAQLASSNKLDEANYVSKCTPVIIQLWSMSDRAVRTSLLKTLKSLMPITPAVVVNKNIFDPMLAGFADSNAKMREDTLKNLVHVVEKLDEKHMQDKLVRCITNLQSDSEASIRTNATIFLGRVASRLKEGVRTRVICPAFAKAMRDPFVHCRVAGLKAAIACLSMLDIAQLTGKLMPQACTLLVDRNSDVRELSLSFLENSTALLRQHHLKEKEAEQREAANGGGDAQGLTKSASSTNGSSSNSSGGWTSWVSEGIAKTVERTVSTSSEPQSAVSSSSSGAASTSSSSGSTIGGVATATVVEDETERSVSRSQKSSSLQSSKLPSFESNLSRDSSFLATAANDDEGGGWGAEDDAWGDDDLNLDDEQEASPVESGKAAEKTRKSSWGEDDDFDVDSSAGSSKSSAKIGGLTTSSSSTSRVVKAVAAPSSVPASAAAAAVIPGGISASKVAKKPKPVIKKLDSSVNEWGDDDW